MLEYNADTPTSLLEASVIQWDWLNDYNSSQKTKHDQFNSIHEGLISYFKSVKQDIDCMHLTCSSDSLEDLITTKYLEDVCSQSGIKTQFLYMNEIGWESRENHFVDLNNQRIRHIFKLYPWEWLCHEEFGKHLADMTDDSYWIEPAWKMLLSNKGILPILWELYPDNELLLPAYFDKAKLTSTSYVKKPFLSREGSNIQILKNNQVIAENEGNYGEEGYIYQDYFEIPQFNNFTPIIGSWVIDQTARGIGIREDKCLITGNESHFVPHYFY
jgi:glutathionylspermidine synthase